MIAALAVSGLVTGGVWRLISQLGDAHDRVRVEQSAFASLLNGERLLRSLLARAELGLPPEGGFTGDATGASFHSWCLTPGGWLERCRATLAIVRGADSSAVVVRAGSEAVVVIRRRGAAAFLYYDAGQPAAPWSTTWTSDVTLPDAVGVAFGVLAADTVLLPTGAR